MPGYIIRDRVHDQQGMTLLEILIAMVILAGIVSMVTLSISGSFKVVNATQQQGELYYRAQVALQRISDDLVSAVLIDDVDGSNDDENLITRFARRERVLLLLKMFITLISGIKM